MLAAKDADGRKITGPRRREILKHLRRYRQAYLRRRGRQAGGVPFDGRESRSTWRESQGGAGWPGPNSGLRPRIP